MKNEIVILDMPTLPVSSTEFSCYLDAKRKIYWEKIFSEKFNQYYKIKTPPNASYKIGLLYISSILKSEGYNVSYYNTDTQDIELMFKVIKGCKYFLISDTTPQIPVILAITKRVKNINPSCKVIIGGPHSTYNDKEIIDFPQIDFIVRGEGEITIKELINELEGNSGKLHKILGITYKENNKIRRNKERKPIKDIDILPIPDFDCLPGGLGKYHCYIHTSRGCPYKCKFCIENDYWGGIYRTHSNEYISQMLLICAEKIGSVYDMIHIADDIFPANFKRMSSLEKSFKNIGKFFSCDSRIDLISTRLLELLKKMNIIQLNLGIENICNDVLKNVSKQLNQQKMIDILKKIKPIKNGMLLKTYWIVGLPGENLGTISKNIEKATEWIQDDLIDIASIRIFVPYPGSEIYNNKEKYGLYINSQSLSDFERYSYPPVAKYQHLDSETLYIAYLMFQSSLIRAYSKKIGIIDVFDQRLPTINNSYYNSYGRLI